MAVRDVRCNCRLRSHPATAHTRRSDYRDQADQPIARGGPCQPVQVPRSNAAASASPPAKTKKYAAPAARADELDKRVMNLMQGKFPLERRPYARVAELAETQVTAPF